MITTHTERERERERANLLSEIQQLEQITNRTAEQEQRLQELKERLAELERQQGQSSQKPTSYLPWILGGLGIALVVGIIVFFLTRKKEK